MGSGMGSGMAAYEMSTPLASGSEVVHVQHASESWRTKARLLAAQQRKCGTRARFFEVLVDGAKAEVVFDVLLDEHVGCCTSWKDSLPQVALPESMKQLGKRITRTEVRAMSWAQLQLLDRFVRGLLAPPPARR